MHLYLKDGDDWRPLTPADLAGSGGSGGGGGGAVTVADGADVTQGDIQDAAVAAGAEGTLSAKLRRLTTDIDAQNTRIGATNEGAASSDTAASGINGRLQRIAQRLTSLIAQIPATLGAKAGSASLSVVPATDAVLPVVGFASNPSVSFTRPADTTQYAVGDLVGNSTTAASVTRMQITVGRAAGESLMLRRCRLSKSGTSITNASFRVHIFNANSTAPTFTNGDNGAFLCNRMVDYIGAFDVTMDRTFVDGVCGISETSEMTIKLPAIFQWVGCYIEARAAYTPANGETFTLALDVLQN